MTTVPDVKNFTRFVCWESEAADRLLTTEATAGHEAQFMATHAPVTGFVVEGSASSTVESASESGLLASLTRESTHHAFVVVEGEPGSGKSHLIRWLKVNWPHRAGDQDVVLLINRADGSLQGTLSQLRDKLPDQYRHLFAHVGVSQSLSPQGQASMFLLNLATMAKSSSFAQDPPIFADFFDTQKVEQLLKSSVLDQWSAPRDILEILNGKGGERDSEQAQFNERHMVELADLLEKAHDQVGIPNRLKTLLIDDAKWLRHEGIGKGKPLKEYQHELRAAHKLIEGLNSPARLNLAVRNLLGIASQDLKALFRTLRQHLKRDGKRLVLLLEDVANFQGVDDQLLEALIHDAASDPSVCDMIAVVGITPDYYRTSFEAFGNRVQRITHLVRLGRMGDGDEAAAYALSAQDDRQRFVATYLRAARATDGDLMAWYPEREKRLVPNKCSGCAFRDDCHRTFGSYRFDPDLPETEVGLYPLSERAIENLFRALKDPAGKIALQTPRGLLQNVMMPLLQTGAALQSGEYPPKKLEGAYLPPASRQALGALDRMLAMRPDSDATKDRLRRLLVWWGQRDSVKTDRDPVSGLRFASVPQAIFTAFDLPWLGADDVSSVPVADEAHAEPPQLTATTLTKTVSAPQRPIPPDDHLPPTPPLPRPVARQPELKTPATKAAGPGTVQAEQLSRHREELSLWASGESLPNADAWGARLWEVMEGLPWKVIGIDPYVKARLFTKDTVMLDGAKAGSTFHFVLPREDWVKAGLDSHVILRARPFPAQEDREYHRRTVAAFLRRMKPLIVAHAARVLPGADGAAWEPAPMIAQLLQARSWLRGGSSPDALPAAQWEALLAHEKLPTTSPDSRTESWMGVLNKTLKHDEWRSALIEMTNIPQGADGSGRFADAGAVALAMRQLATDLRIVAPPTLPKFRTTKEWSVLESAAKAGPEVASHLPKLPGFERRRLFTAIEELQTLRQGLALSTFMHRAAEVVEEVCQIAPGAPPLPRTTVFKLQQSLNQQDLWRDEPGSPLEVLSQWLQEFEPESVDALKPAAALSWALAMPYMWFNQAHTAVKQLDQSLVAIEAYVRGLIGTQGDASAGGLSVVHETGEAMADAGQQILKQGGTHD